MKVFARNALLGAAGLIALSLPAHALGSTTLGDTSAILSKAATLDRFAAWQDDGYGRMRDTAAGSVGFKKSKKKPKKKK
jgi:hypothetical protein